MGAGGAGFPSYAKLACGADTLLLNCAECEPLLSLHRGLLAEKSLEIITAFSEIGKALDVKKCIIGIKRAYKSTLDAITPVVKNFDNVEIKLLREVYPAGDEIVLIYQTTGRVVSPGALPISAGVIVYNVETVYNAYLALHEDTPVTTKLVIVTGEVKNPRTVRVPLGMETGEVIARCGGTLTDDFAIVSGGAMMGKIISVSDVVTKTTNALLVLPQNHAVVKSKLRNAKIDARRAASACCQCRMCTDLCPRHLLGYPIDPARFMRAVSNKDGRDTQAYVNALYCSGCGVCEAYSCMQGLSPRLLLDVAKRQLRAGGIKPEVCEPAPIAATRDARRVPMARLAARLGLEKYDKKVPRGEDFTTRRVRLPLSMHIGAPSVPVVKAGDTVVAGQTVAQAGKGLSVALHSPISGRVKLVANEIVIEN